MPINTIIFDLGDVLMPLNKKRMYDKFKELGVHAIEELFLSKGFQELYTELEKNLGADKFRARLRELFHLGDGISNEQINEAWSAMLDDIPQKRLDYLRELKKRGYKLLLLSNSNEIHYDNIQSRYGDVFAELFDTQYYSHKLELAKPDVEVFKHVIREQGQDAGEFFFLDDKQDNIEGAKKAGIRAMQHTVYESETLIRLDLRRINAQMHPLNTPISPLFIFQHNNLESELRENWHSLVMELGGDEAFAEQWWCKIRESYKEPHRYYHTLLHIQDMTRHYAEHVGSLNKKNLVLLAIWFHDVIYEPQKKDNEERSRDLFVKFANELGLDEKDIQCVASYIMATKTHQLDPEMLEDSDLLFFLDFDLAILGDHPERYLAYARNISSEYIHMADEKYRSGRVAVLNHLLEGTLYKTDVFQNRYLKRARSNMANEIQSLQLVSLSAMTI